MKRIRHIINSLVWLLVGLYATLVVITNLPITQRAMGKLAASLLSDKFGTSVSVGKVNLGLFNRIIVDDVSMLDQQHALLLRATRLSAKFSYADLLRGRLTIVSAQIFGLDANLYQATATSKPNFQFVVDSLASKDTTQHKPLHLDINSLIIRHGKIAWNRLYKPRKAGFDVNHLSASDISSHVMLHILGGDSLLLTMRKLAFNEASGFRLLSLSLKASMSKQHARLSDFRLVLPHSELSIPLITASYNREAQDFISTLSYQSSIAESHVYLPDISPFLTVLKGKSRQLVVKADLRGKGKTLQIPALSVSMPQSSKATTLAAPSDIRLLANGQLRFGGKTPSWNVDIPLLTIDGEGMKVLAGDVPDMVSRLHTLRFVGKTHGNVNLMALSGHLLSGAGEAQLNFLKRGNDLQGHLQTGGFRLGQVLDNDDLGLLAADINGEGNVKDNIYKVKGRIDRIDYKDYPYRNIKLDAAYNRGLAEGTVSINDDNARLSAEGFVDMRNHQPVFRISALVDHLMPSKMHLLGGRLGEATYHADIHADFSGRDINQASGSLRIDHLTMEGAETSYALDSLTLHAGASESGHFVRLESDFGRALLYGYFDYASLPQLLKNVIVRHLPSIQALAPLHYKDVKGGGFSLSASFHRADWLQAFFGLPVTLYEPFDFKTAVGPNGQTVEGWVSAPDMQYDNRRLKDVSARILTEDGVLRVSTMLRAMRSNGLGTDLHLQASAGNDKLQAAIEFDNHARAQRLRGGLESDIAFSRNADGHGRATWRLHPSQIFVDDTVFQVHPSVLSYSDKRLEVNDFAITSGNQRISLEGVASAHSTDSITAHLENVNVGYVLDAVNFHSVSFDGRASGEAYVKQIFSKPQASGRIRVDDFQFIHGRLGTLHANVDWNPDEGQIDIDAVALDTIGQGTDARTARSTTVKGYVSPTKGYIDLSLGLHETRGEFLGYVCSSFLDHVQLSATGPLRLWGPLKNINLTGEVVAHGETTVTPLGCHYKLKHSQVSFIENEIVFDRDTITDDRGQHGLITGGIHHDHLKRWSYDLDIEARHLKAFQSDGSDGSTFYGQVWGTGSAAIKGGAGAVNISVSLTPEEGSEVVYDISSPEAVGSNDFIHWTSRDTPQPALRPAHISDDAQADDDDDPDIPSDVRINFLINTTPEATLRVITDKQTGDYIALNGSGTLRANWFNKGGVELFGTYTVARGTYKLTIQNIIKKNFEFADGGTIVFGGDPSQALLNLRAIYPVTSVSLSDLQIGRNFSSNNIRVNCLMNISGTPASPKVAFDLDFPSLDTDAKQMILSVINGEEEMNQQVLYLLAVGRFYTQGSNNAGQSSNQTSLAMQSILSGQLSQQINNVLSGLIKNKQWNFGANISTGDEGWNNAEYEGLLSGRMLNNRLLLNGQFGYRDNANATQSFIGDFDLRYLITPNGNLSVHVYNKTNDRYFTRNSLNTQGLGFVLKKDFSSLRDLFRWSKSRR